MRVLVAEDDAASATLLVRTLKTLGYEPASFGNGRDAFIAHEAEPFPIVVSDWDMPEMNGLELCHWIRRRKSRDYTYFILLTAMEQNSENYAEAMEAGIDDFLPKPLNRDNIWQRLRVADRILGYTNQISALEEMLPICSYCKRIRDDQDYWQQVESYIGERTGSHFSHSICPDCYTNVVKPQIDEITRKAPTG